MRHPGQGDHKAEKIDVGYFLERLTETTGHDLLRQSD